MSYTNGPWVRWNNEAGEPIAQVYTDDGRAICVMASEPDDDSEALANAALIAAAPELVEALRVVELQLTGHPEVCDGKTRVYVAHRAARAALVKALAMRPAEAK